MIDLFKKYDLKLTSQRQLVLEAVHNLEDDATATKISEYCHGKVNKSTVYRIIDLFLEKGLFEKHLNFNNESYYNISEEHAHYIKCVKCHKREKIDNCPIDNFEKKLEQQKGYKILNHVIELDVICNDCQSKD